ncbi:hypothetical protein ABZS94_28800 [Streptomyces sp. NPDC005500]|uniref:hypothetical protein n=1 Tax=Streptomyces sp. NPDC005500 TaxID=3155007 RepID=UPI0033A35C54
MGRRCRGPSGGFRSLLAVGRRHLVGEGVVELVPVLLAPGDGVPDELDDWPAPCTVYCPTKPRPRHCWR